MHTRDICCNSYIVIYHLGRFLLMLDMDGLKHTKTTQTDMKPTLV